MIIDKIENHSLYRGKGENLDLGFDFLLKTNLSDIALGKHEIKGEDVFAIVMEYDTKDKSECKTEGHHKYVDLQYIVSGSESIGITTRMNHKPEVSNKEKDCDFYDIESDVITFKSGVFMVFYPNDLHQPGISIDEVSKVRKVVVKVKHD